MVDASRSTSDTTRERADEEVRRHKTFLDELFEMAPDALVLTTLRNPTILRINREFTRTFGYTSEEAVGRCLRDLVMPDGREPTLPEDPDLLAGGKVEWEVIRRRKDGTRFHAHITGKRIQLSDDEDAAYLIFSDISARKEAEALFAGEKRLLEVIAAGGPLTTTLDALCRLAEDVDGSALVSLLLLDHDGKFHPGAGPSLPQSYVDALDGWPVGLGLGPCGAAAHLGEQVISLDLAADERWGDTYRAIARANGLRACWSTPIKSSQGRVLGTFAVYPSEPWGPSPEQAGRIEQLTHLASIAIERAQSMDALRRSEERYALAMEAATDGHMDWNLVTGEFYISPRMLQMVGHAPDATFVDRADWVRRFPFHPEDRPRWEAAIAAHFAGREARFRGDFRIVVNGETRWLAFNFIATRDAAGKVARWTGSITDLSDAKRDVATVVESIPGLVAILTPAGELDAVNDQLAEYCGQPLEAMKQWGTNGTVHTEDLPRVVEIFMRGISTGEPYEFEARVRRFDGVYRWNQVRGHPSRDSNGRIVRWYSVIFDIDDRKRAEEALRESEKRYERAMLAAEAGFWDWDVQADEFYVSPKLLEMADFPAGTRFAGRADFMARVPFHPDDCTKWERAVKELFASGGTRLAMEIRSIHGGETHWSLLSGMCVRDAAGKILRWTGSSTDVTARKRAEGLLAGEKHLLEMMARATPLSAVLDALCRIIEENLGGYLCGISLVDATGSRLLNGAAPSLPRGYVQAIDDKAMERDAGPCCMAALMSEQVVSVDIATETRWVEQGWCALALSHGLRSIWTTPIVSSAKRALGTFAVYFTHPSSPTDEYLAVIERFNHVAAIAIERSHADDALRRSEAALRVSEERYALALEASEEGHYDIDLQTDEIFVSARVNEIYGFPAQAETLKRGEFFARIPFHPDDRPRVLAEVSKPDWNDRNLHEIQCQIVPRPGETRWTRSRAKVVRDAQGRAVRRVGVLADITERKRAEEALRAQTERLQLGQAAMRMIIMDWNVTEDLLTWSDSPEWLRGPMPASGSYPAFKDQVHPEDRDRFLATRQRALETLQVQTTEFRLVRTDGEVIWVLERKHAFAGIDGKPVRMLAAMFDITDRKRAEEALRRSEGALRLSEERYALAMDASEEGHFDWNVATDEIFASEHLKKVLELPVDLKYRTRHDMVSHMPFYPGDGERVAQMAREVLAGGAREHEFEYCLMREPGAQPRWIRARWNIFRDAQGAAERVIGVVSDITERRRVGEALRQSEERYVLAVDGASQGIFDWDLSNDRVFHSRRAQELFGLQAGESWRARHEWVAVIRYHPEDVPRIRANIRRLLNGETTMCDDEYRVVPREGEVRWLRQRGVLQRDASGNAHRMAGSIEDVTERKVAAEALRESEMRFRALTALWSDWYWRQDEHLRFTYSSAAGNWPDGSPRSSVIGMTRWEIPGIVPLSSSWAEHRALLAARKPFRDFEYCRLSSDGTMRYVSSSGTPIVDDKGEFRGYQGVACDITERKRVHEELRSRQEMLDLAQKAARAVAFEWRADPGEGERGWSPELEAMYGIPAGSYDGTYESWKKLVHVEDWPNVRAAIQCAQQTGDVDAEYRVLHPGGAIRWLHAKGRMFFDQEGRPGRIVGFMLDVTDRHLAEEELKQMERQLRQAQRLEALGTLAGGIAHDFNNLLGAILGYGEMALRNVRAGCRLRRDIESMMIAGERGHALVERILAFSRSGVGERVAVHVEKVVRETLALFAAKLPRHISIERRLHAGSAAVMGDPTQIHQVLMNLLTNAVQAVPSTGTLHVSLDRVHFQAPRVVTTGSIAAREYVVMEVSDSGSGIPAEIFEKIFDPFFTTKEVGVGTGLGLSLVHGIVTGLGGAIDVTTTVGKGSVFAVYLPSAGDAAVPSKPRKRPEPKTRRSGRGRVLVIDDEEALVRLVTEMLTQLGYSAVGFTASAKALEAFLAHPEHFDAVITDESMPGASGSDLIRKMRALRPTLPILLVSGYLNAAVIERAREAGATEVLKKPLPARQLQVALERALPSKRSPSANDLASSSTSAAKPRRKVGLSRSPSGSVRRGSR